MVREDILQWVKQEFFPLTLATSDIAINQAIDNALRYWNTHSSYRTVKMISAYAGDAKIQMDAEIKSVVTVHPAAPPEWILQNYPQWSLLGISILDNVNSDLIMMTEAFKNYKYYIGNDFRWHFEKSEDSTVGGYLYLTNVPTNTTNLCVIGTKRIKLDTATDEITDEFITDWVLQYTKSLVKQMEGNTLRKADAINVKNDGQTQLDEGRESMKELQEKLASEGRWMSFARRM